MQNLANQLLDAFIDKKKVTKSHIPAANASTRIDVPEEQLANESKIRLKHGSSIGSKDITPRNKRTQRRIDTSKEVHDKQKVFIEAYDKQKVPEEVYGEQEALVEAYIEQKTSIDVRNKEITLEEAQIPKNYEISINYVHNREKWDRNKVIINNIFVFQVDVDIIRNDEDPEPQNVEECRNGNDWPKLKEAMQAYLNSLMKR